jgi:hypothetical protein
MNLLFKALNYCINYTFNHYSYNSNYINKKYICSRASFRFELTTKIYKVIYPSNNMFIIYI